MAIVLNLVVVVMFGLAPAVLLSALAGRWDLWNVWATAGIVLAWNVLQTLVASRRHPEVLRERVSGTRTGRGARVHNIASGALLLVTAAQWSIAGIDHRFHWTDDLPSAVVVAGMVLVAIGWGLGTWTTLVNPGVFREIHLQGGSGARLVREGPYAIIRHPSFATITLAMLSTGLALDSLLSIIPAVILVFVIIRVTANADAMRQDELAWYAAYAAKVRYRLVPGVW
jgi:protein-S-isoprenylcysteine O-methyltransferase Ste14